MKKLLLAVYRWFASWLDAEAGTPPFPFDDAEGEKLWQKGKAVAEEEKAADRAVSELIQGAGLSKSR